MFRWNGSSSQTACGTGAVFERRATSGLPPLLPTSLQDNLFRIFGGDRIKGLMSAFRIEDLPIESQVGGQILRAAASFLTRYCPVAAAHREPGGWADVGMWLLKLGLAAAQVGLESTSLFPGLQLSHCGPRLVFCVKGASCLSTASSAAAHMLTCSYGPLPQMLTNALDEAQRKVGTAYRGGACTTDARCTVPSPASAMLLRLHSPARAPCPLPSSSSLVPSTCRRLLAHPISATG